MHALFVTFHSTAQLEALRDPFLEAAGAIRDIPGLLSKTWLQEGERLGGFYLFRDATAAQGYLDGPIVANLMTEPAFSDFEVRHLTALEDLSAITRGVPALAATTSRNRLTP